MKYTEFLQRTSLTTEELINSGNGTLVEDPPEGGLARLPSPPFLMFDRITTLTRSGRKDEIVAEQDIHHDAWYFQCHFQQDPVKPGCLGVDALWQLLGFYLALNGAIGSGRALGCKEVDFFGQIRPFDKVVRYELSIRKLLNLKDSGAMMGIADGNVLVDGTLIYRVKDLKVGVFRDIAYSDYPNPNSRHARGGILQPTARNVAREPNL